ncbi:hypothetical protein FSP39_003755 [Pinctada imbricata]|uniref:Uncharacterized protein n=1 Tax=Pinctada imbricata TaxID=66713 RepID=A0AA89C9K0_PINIB|nr:hypothetical protein FSP39_003755 [Pinctada imbricata]
MSTFKRKVPDHVSPPAITRFVRRRFISGVMSNPQTPNTDPESASGDHTIEFIGDPPAQIQYLPNVELTTESGTQIDLSGVIINLLHNQLFINGITTILTPVLSQALCPNLQSSINDAIKDAVQPLNDQIKQLTTKVDDNEKQIKKLSDENDKLRSELNIAFERVDRAEADIEELEQYGRRTSLRFHNVEVADTNNTDDEIVKLCKEKLQVDITPDDINRSHPIGRKNRHGKYQLICRFKNWKIKNKIYREKKKLKNDSSRIFVTEDLTSYRQEIVSEIAKAKRAGKVFAFWTNDGRIFIKTSSDGPKYLIRSLHDLNYYAPPSDHYDTDDEY